MNKNTRCGLYESLQGNLPQTGNYVDFNVALAEDTEHACDCANCNQTLHPESCDVYEVQGVPSLGGEFFCTGECAKEAAGKVLYPETENE